MKPTKKEVNEAKAKAKKVEKKDSNKRLSDIEQLVLLIDERITQLQSEMSEMKYVCDRIRKRMGL